MNFVKHSSAIEEGLLLGWEEPAGSTGFARQCVSGNAIVYGGDAPCITLAPTGAGKGRGAIMPAVLRHNGSLIVVDIKGEIAACCWRLRQRLGQLVILDPFGVMTNHSGGLNPLDLFELPGAAVDSDAEMFANLLATGFESAKDPYWHIAASGVTGGLIAHIATTESDPHLGRLREWLFHEDMDLKIAKTLDAKAVRCRMAYEQFVGYLAAPAEQTRPCIRSMACSFVNALSSDKVAKTLQTSTFNLRDLLDGKPLSIFLVIPPDKLESHKALLRLWIGTLLTVVMRRPHIPRQRTLFLLDEAAQFGTLPALRTATTLLRGSGLQVWSFWQDSSQLKNLYPNDWQTMVNNAAVVQAFGVNNHHMAKEWADLFGRPVGEVAALRPEQTLVQIQGQGCRICRRPDYLRDPLFQGLYEPNPRFALHAR
jgi:type IV secretion system protein VirD4